MPVTQYGTPNTIVQATTSGACTVTGTWNASQPRAAGHLLVASVTAGCGTSTTAISTPAGWTKVSEAVSGLVRAAIYWKVAAGADAGPAFSSTLTGTGPRMTCYLRELAGADNTTPVPANAFGAGTGTTGTSCTATTTATTFPAGCLGLAVSCQYRTTAATATWTPGGSWASQGANTGTSTNFHASADYYNAAVPTGAALSQAGTWGAAGSNIATLVVVFAPPAEPEQASPKYRARPAGFRRPPPPPLTVYP